MFLYDIGCHVHSNSKLCLNFSTLTQHTHKLIPYQKLGWLPQLVRRKTIEMLYTWLHDTIASETVPLCYSTLLHAWKLENKVKTTLNYHEFYIILALFCLCFCFCFLQQGSHLMILSLTLY